MTTNAESRRRLLAQKVTLLLDVLEQTDGEYLVGRFRSLIAWSVIPEIRTLLTSEVAPTGGKEAP